VMGGRGVAGALAGEGTSGLGWRKRKLPVASPKGARCPEDLPFALGLGRKNARLRRPKSWSMAAHLDDRRAKNHGASS